MADGTNRTWPYGYGSGGDDPPVYAYNKRDSAPRRTHDRFSAFLQGNFDSLRKTITTSSGRRA